MKCFRVKNFEYNTIYCEDEKEYLFEKINKLEKENAELKKTINVKNPVGRPKNLDWENMTERQKYSRSYYEIKKKRKIKQQSDQQL